MTKRISWLILAVIASSLISCGSLFVSRFQKEQDTTRSSVKYGKTELYAGLLRQSDFNEFKMYGRRMIVENTDYSDKEKSKVLDSLDKMQYSKNQFFYFSILFNMPFLPSELDMKFKITDETGKDYYSGSVLIPIKQMVISSYGTTTTYNYTFVIKTTEPLDNISKTSKVKLQIDLPDKTSTAFQIKI